MVASIDAFKRECNRHRSVYPKFTNINRENEIASLRGFHLVYSKGRQRETCEPGNRRDKIKDISNMEHSITWQSPWEKNYNRLRG